MSDIPFVELNTGVKMSAIGFGTWQAEDGDEAKNSVAEALKAGYRLIDTAKIYGNEKSVGQAIKESGVHRDEIFVTTKLWNSDQGYDSALAAFDKSLQDLGLEYVDLYLIHWPTPGREKYLDSWRALEKVHKEGRAKAVGISNFSVENMQDVLDNSDTVPAVNQIEFHPFIYEQQKPILEFAKQEGIAIEAYSPLSRGKNMDNPVISEIAKKHSKTNAQVMLRWAIQHQTVPLPKSTHAERIKQNLQVFDFELSNEDIERINGLSNGRSVI
jgi:diketogulonate reductase-like aldo/keto reductase